MNITVIGLGLIGGSMAIALKEKGLAKKIIGVDNNLIHQQKALELGLVDEVLEMNEAIAFADVVIIAIPVNAAEKVLETILNTIDRQVVMDVGSTKNAICAMADGNKNGHRFVATHPMWGTEYSGPEAALRGAFENKAGIICNKENSATDAVMVVEKIYKTLGMHIVYMDAKAHDVM